MRTGVIALVENSKDQLEALRILHRKKHLG
jgi:hypothetical protein